MPEHKADLGRERNDEVIHLAFLKKKLVIVSQCEFSW